VPKDFKSFLPPKLIRLLEHKVRTGEMTTGECQTVLKEFMLREFDRMQAEKTSNIWRTIAIKYHDRARSLLKKVRQRPPAEPTISMEELAGTVRTRRI